MGSVGAGPLCSDRTRVEDTHFKGSRDCAIVADLDRANTWSGLAGKRLGKIAVRAKNKETAILLDFQTQIPAGHGLTVFHEGELDDIDHLGNRRVRLVGELLGNQIYLGFARIERIVRERFRTNDAAGALMPQDLLNVKPLTAVLRRGSTRTG